jgi:hypothetical protein
VPVYHVITIDKMLSDEREVFLFQELLGHERAEITRKRYTHASRESLRKMMEEVDRFFQANLQHVLPRLLSRSGATAIVRL